MITPRATRLARTFAVALAAASCREPAFAPPRAAPPPPRVTVARVEAVPPPRYAGSVYVERDVLVTAPRSGVVAEVLVDRGDAVRSGQVLARLQCDVERAEREKARAALRMAESDRARMLALRVGDVVSKQEAFHTEVEHDVAVAELALREAELDACSLRAPFDGFIVDRWVTSGQRVREDDEAPLFRIAGSGPRRVRIHVPAASLDGIATGADATVFASGASVPGHVAFVGSAVDPASATAPVIVELGGEGPAALGSVVDVGFPSRLPECVRVPLGAFATPPRAMGSATLLALERGRVTRRTVRTIAIDGASVDVAGLDAMLPVVVDAPPGLAEGAAVEASEAR